MTDHPLPPPSSLLPTPHPDRPITLVMRRELAEALADFLERMAYSEDVTPTPTEAQAARFVIDHVRGAQR